MNWLCITFGKKLTFTQHRLDVISKGSQRAGFVESMSNFKWVVPPHLIKILLKTTVHTGTDYIFAAWMPLKMPKYFTDKLSVIDHTCTHCCEQKLSVVTCVII